jgi:hypothetical protein
MNPECRIEKVESRTRLHSIFLHSTFCRLNSALTFMVFSVLVAFTGCGEDGGNRVEADGGGGLFKSRKGSSEVWTIECNEFIGPQHERTARVMADALRKVSGLNPKSVSTQDAPDRSRVFYGSYELKYMRTKTGNAGQADTTIALNDAIKKDLDLIRQLAIGDKHPFLQARAIQKPSQDFGPKEWDLRNARGTYTLQVGITYNTPNLLDYKAAAIEWVKDLRSRGHEAYYYHDPGKPQTSICVGTFGENSFFRDKDGRTGYSDAVKKLRMQEEFKYNLENGHIVYRIAANPETGKKERMPNWSFLVKIPQKSEPRP